MTRLICDDTAHRITVLRTIANAPDLGAFDLASLKTEILGQAFELSILFIGRTRMRSLNYQTRDRDAATDILSFRISPTSGELFLCPEIANRKAPTFGYQPNQYIRYLLIHGCLHLKGLDHGRTMSEQEARLVTRYDI
jgi:probable rRNA maturation factor